MKPRLQTDLEREFRRDRARRTLPLVRAGLLVGLVLCSAFLFAGDSALRMKTLSALALLLSALAWSFHSSFRRWIAWTPALVFGAVAALVLSAGAGVRAIPPFLGGAFFLGAIGLSVLVIPQVLEAFARRDFVRQRENRGLRKDLEQKTRALDEASAALDAAQSDLVKAADAAVLGRLVSGLIHELSSPLGVIRTGADLSENAVMKLENSGDPPPKRITDALLGAHRASLAATERLSAILQSLRNVSRVDRDQVDAVDVHEGLEDALTLLAPRLHNGIAVRRKLGEIPRIHCQAAELSRVFLHVLLNAVQAIESSGTITIETSCEGNAVSVRVMDDGRGIDSAVLELLLLPPFRRTGTEAKAGMGLFLSHQIVEKHGGRMLVKSEGGRGTSVTIKLPRDRSLGVA